MPTKSQADLLQSLSDTFWEPREVSVDVLGDEAAQVCFYNAWIVLLYGKWRVTNDGHLALRRFRQQEAGDADKITG